MRLCRIHRAGRSPWWFSHDGTGRFDLAGGRGTCYLAEESAGCFLEVFRPWLLIPEPEVAARRISRPVPSGGELLLADCTEEGARAFGVTGEIHSTSDYALTRRWAAAFADAGFDGIRYLLRHDPAQRLAGIALFGPAGAPPWPTPVAEPLGPDLLREIETRFGLRVLPVP